MDAAQILMMPTASPGSAPLTPLSGGNGMVQATGETTDLFRELLAKTIQTHTAADQIPELDITTAVQNYEVSLGAERPEQDQEVAALVIEHELLEPETTATQQLSAVYVQLAVLQTPPMSATPLQDASVLQDGTERHEDANQTVQMLAGSEELAAFFVDVAEQGAVKTGEAHSDKQPLQMHGQVMSGQAQNGQQNTEKLELAANLQMQEKQIERPQPVANNRVHDLHIVAPSTAGNRGPDPQIAAQPDAGTREQGQPPVTAQVQAVRRDGAQDTPVAAKNNAEMQVQQFRFAQASEVTAAVADSGNHAGVFSEHQQAPSFRQPATVVQDVPNELLDESSALVQQNLTLEEHQQAGVSSGLKLQAAVTAMPEPEVHPKQVYGDQHVARQLVERLSSHDIKPGSDQISLKLSPEHLGNVQLNLRMEEQGLKLEIIAEHRGVREALLRQGDELRETLARQNIRIDSFEVSTGSLGGQSQQQHREWRQMNPEQRIYHAQYASAARGSGAVQESLQTVQYFTPQYQSTIDVRF